MDMGKKSVILALVASLALSAREVKAAISDQVLVRSRANGRQWQTDYSADKPLTWRWEGADSAEITVTNHANGTVTGSVVVRSEGDDYGTLPLSDVKDSSGRMADAVFDVGIVLKKGDSASYSLFARVARVTGAGCNAGPTVLKSQKSQWGFVKSASAVVPYDTVWQAGAAGAEVTFDSVAVASGKSGYAPVPMPAGTDGVVSLSFDGELYAQSRIVRVVSGMFLILR